MQSCDIYLGMREIGTLKWEQTGAKVRFWASCPVEVGYIYRLLLSHSGQEPMSLGIMMPQGNRFTLEKTVPARQWPMDIHTRCEVVRTLPGEQRALPLPFAFSALQPIRTIPFSWEDQLAKCLQGTQDLLYTVFENRVYLLFPMEIGGELIQAAFFCCITPLYLQGRWYGAVSVDEQGQAVIIQTVSE